MRILAATLALASGCSWATARPIRYHANGYVECSGSTAAPALDATVAVTAGFVALLAMLGSNQGRADDDDEKAAGVIALGAGGLFAASAISGRRQGRECRTARAALMGPRWIAPSGTPDSEPLPPPRERDIHIDINVTVD